MLGVGDQGGQGARGAKRAGAGSESYVIVGDGVLWGQLSVCVSSMNESIVPVKNMLAEAVTVMYGENSCVNHQVFSCLHSSLTEHV